MIYKLILFLICVWTSVYFVSYGFFERGRGNKKAFFMTLALSGAVATLFIWNIFQNSFTF